MTTSFSMELGNGDDSLAAGIAQRYPDGTAAWLNTPALQTNFSPASTAFWQQVYLDMADVMANAGVTPYLQFGEVQWWYFAAASGMPFYDAYTKSAFQTAHGRPLGPSRARMQTPPRFPDECAFLPTLIGAFTQTIMNFVRPSHADARFEVLYPPDTNDTPLNQLINLPIADWTAGKTGLFQDRELHLYGEPGFEYGASVHRAADAAWFSALAKQPPGGHWRLHHAMGERTAAGTGRRDRVGGAVRPGSVLPDRVRAAVARWGQAGVVYGGSGGARRHSVRFNDGQSMRVLDNSDISTMPGIWATLERLGWVSFDRSALAHQRIRWLLFARAVSRRGGPGGG